LPKTLDIFIEKCGSHTDYQNVAELLPQLENTPFPLEGQPYKSLLLIYKKQFLDVSVSKGLINRDGC